MRNLFFIGIILIFSSGISAQDGNYADVNGVKLYYETYGTGEPLVLLHGFTMSHDMWDQWIDDLSRNNKLIIPDLRGHGNSTNPSNEFTHGESAKDVYELLDYLNIDEFQAIGYSSGAMTLTHMAIMDSTRIQELVLIGSTSFFPESCRILQKSSIYEEIDNYWLNGMKRRHPGGEKQIRNLLNQFQNMAYSYDDMNFTPPYLARIKCPTLIIHGDRDSYFPIDIPVASYTSIPNSFLWVVPNFGHGYIGKRSIWADSFVKVLDVFFSGKWN